MKLSIIAASILACLTWPMAAETISFPMGSAGQVLFEYQLESTPDPQYQYRYTTQVSGAVTNQTGFPINCSLNSKDLVVRILAEDLAPGARATFQKKAQTSLKWNPYDVFAWEAKCSVNFQYAFSKSIVEKRFPGGSVAATMNRDQIDFVLNNDSDQPIEILWNESSLIDIDRTASRILHKGIKYADREQSLPDTTVPPQARVDELAAPSQNISFDSDHGWHAKALLPQDSPVDGAQALMDELKGQKIVLFLQLRIAGRKVPVSLPFGVASVLPK